MEEIIGACAEEGPSKRYCHLHVYIYHRPEPGCFSRYTTRSTSFTVHKDVLSSQRRYCMHSADAAAARARVAKHRTFAFVYADQHMSMNQCLSWANAIQRLSQGEAIEWEGTFNMEQCPNLPTLEYVYQAPVYAYRGNCSGCYDEEVPQYR